jgi:cell division protein ZapE
MVLLAQAEARPFELYPVDHGTEAFEFDRTISRLREMQDDSWLSTKGGNRVSE